MTITVHWWYIPTFLVVLPFIYNWLTPEVHGNYAFDLNLLLVFIICWMLAIGIIVGRVLS